MPNNTPPPGWPVGEPYEPYIPSGPSTPGTDYDRNPTKNWYPNGKYGWDDPFLNGDAVTRNERYPHYWSYGDPDPEWRPSFFGETPPWNRNPNDKSGSANTQKGDWFGNTMRDKPKMSPEQRAWEKAEYAREDAERARAKQASRERTQQPSSSSGYPAQQGVSDMQTTPWNTNDSYSYGGGGQYGGPQMPSYGGGAPRATRPQIPSYNGGGQYGGPQMPIHDGRYGGSQMPSYNGGGMQGGGNGVARTRDYRPGIDGPARGYDDMQTAPWNTNDSYGSGGRRDGPPIPSYNGGGQDYGSYGGHRFLVNGDGTAAGAMLRRPNPYPSGGPPPPMTPAQQGISDMQTTPWNTNDSYGGGGQYGGPPMPSYNGGGQDFGRIAQGFGQGGGAPMDFAQGFGGADMLRNMMGNRGGMGGGGNPFQNMMGGMAGMGRGNPFMSMMGGMGGGNPFQNMMGGMGGGGNPFMNMMGGMGGGGNPFMNMMGRYR